MSRLRATLITVAIAMLAVVTNAASAEHGGNLRSSGSQKQVLKRRVDRLLRKSGSKMQCYASCDQATKFDEQFNAPIKKCYAGCYSKPNCKYDPKHPGRYGSDDCWNIGPGCYYCFLKFKCEYDDCTPGLYPSRDIPDGRSCYEFQCGTLINDLLTRNKLCKADCDEKENHNIPRIDKARKQCYDNCVDSDEEANNCDKFDKDCIRACRTDCDGWIQDRFRGYLLPHSH